MITVAVTINKKALIYFILKHTESIYGWRFWCEQSGSIKFRGTYVDSIPNGEFNLYFEKTGNHYKWGIINSICSGFFTVKLYVNNQGETNIVNKMTNEASQLKFHQVPSYFSKELPHRVTAIIKDKHELARYVLKGSYFEKVEIFSVLNPQNITSFEEVNMLKLSEKQLLWKRNLKE